MMTPINAGFLPLLDAAILIVAREMNFAAQQNIDLRLIRETSWANIRDRVSVGQFDVAHMLAPLPIAQNLGLSPLTVKMIAPFALGLGGNAITVSNALWKDMIAEGADTTGDPKRTGEALRKALKNRQGTSFAVVHNFSAHSFELRYWLSACGIDPAKDVNITIVPPSLMADALAAGTIDGFCVGEPWNSVAAKMDVGRVITTKSAIWRSSPEKVLGLTLKWAESHHETLDRLLIALHQSAIWCSATENREALAEILSRSNYLDVARATLQHGLSGTVISETVQPDFLQFFESAANFPWQSHALWFYAQMARWQQVPLSVENAKLASATYRPDIYRRALIGAGAALPGASSKVEGTLKEATYLPAQGGQLALGPDGFFDNVKFDPDELTRYVESSPFYVAMHKY